MRVQINLSDNMVKRVDALADELGVSRSAFCSMAVGQSVLGYEKSMDAIKVAGVQLASGQSDEQ